MERAINKKTCIFLGLAIVLIASFFIAKFSGITGDYLKLQNKGVIAGFQKAENITKAAAPPASPIGNISHQSIKSDSSINAIIDSSQKLDNGNLLVKFHHNSDKDEPISIIGNVRYELSKTTALPNEVITLTVFDWSTEYFEIKIGKQSSITGFGKKVLE